MFKRQLKAWEGGRKELLKVQRASELPPPPPSGQTFDLRPLRLVLGGQRGLVLLAAHLPSPSLPFALVRYSLDGVVQPTAHRLDLDKGYFVDRLEVGTEAEAHAIAERLAIFLEGPQSDDDLSVFRDTLRDGTPGPELVVIPEGSFLMGSPEDEEGRLDWESPQHQVTVPRFGLGRYAVTFEEYDRYCSAKGIEKPEDEGWGRGRCPVINVSWEDARNYCAWLSAETGKAYRLPSEAEWEYACRAGTVTRYSWGDEFDGKLANSDGQVGKTTPVGEYPANSWKLFDMHGNVWEWCEDDWHGSYDGASSDGSAWVEAAPRESGLRIRVIRGGSWNDDARIVRAACRFRYDRGNRDGGIGFRCARGLE